MLLHCTGPGTGRPTMLWIAFARRVHRGEERLQRVTEAGSVGVVVPLLMGAATHQRTEPRHELTHVEAGAQYV
jgi:hypothetical protein